MKKLPVAIAGGVMLALTACTPADEAESSPTTSTTTSFQAPPQHIETRTSESTPATTAPAIDFDSDEFNGSVLESVFADEGIYLPEGAALEYAKVVCQGMEDDLDLAQMVMIGATHGPVSDIMDNAYMVGASVGALCPEYSSVVDNYEW